jgi:hypothetical protein
VQPGYEGGEVHAAESTSDFLCVKHNGGYRCTDCTSNLMKKVFPDTEIVRKQICANENKPLYAVDTERLHGGCTLWNGGRCKQSVRIKIFSSLDSAFDLMFRANPMKEHKLLNSMLMGE